MRSVVHCIKHCSLYVDICTFIYCKVNQYKCLSTVPLVIDLVLKRGIKVAVVQTDHTLSILGPDTSTINNEQLFTNKIKVL